MAKTSTSFKKGAGGRKQGSTNKITSDLRTWVTALLDNNRVRVQADFEALEPKERILMFEKLLKYALPALQQTQLKTDFESMTDSQLDYIIESLKNPHNEP